MRGGGVQPESGEVAPKLGPSDFRIFLSIIRGGVGRVYPPIRRNIGMLISEISILQHFSLIKISNIFQVHSIELRGKKLAWGIDP